MSSERSGEIEGLAFFEAIYKSGWHRNATVIHKTLNPNMHARLALDMIERWGGVAAEIDGEDSAGRSKVRLQTPQELVDRACSTAALAMAAFHERNWLLPVPVPEPERVEVPPGPRSESK